MHYKTQKSLLSLATIVALSACSEEEAQSTTKAEPAAPVVNSAPVAWPTDKVQFCNTALDKATEQYTYFRNNYTDPQNIPTAWNEEEETKFTTIQGWTAGFVAGSFWYLYEHNQNDEWLKTATDWTEALKDSQFNRKTHDIGFIINDSFGNGFRLTGNQAYPEVLLNAAKTLMERYNPEIGLTFSWSWGYWEFPVIVDNMMNLELLFEASLATGDPRYYEAAISHADKTIKHHFRSDYSSYHLVNYNRDTGLPNWKQTFQGIADDSAWARGQGWGLYGYTSVYRYTKDEKYLDHARGIANYILSHKNMPEDLVAFFDFDAPDREDIRNVKDTSAASLMASALFELATYVEGDEAQRYLDAANKILRNLSSPEYLASKGENGNFLLKQATGNYPASLDIEASLNYGDYYYLQALTRCKTQ
ncbi:glycoside hydrolase family 88 protein [Vibrio comitans]